MATKQAEELKLEIPVVVESQTSEINTPTPELKLAGSVEPVMSGEDSGDLVPTVRFNEDKDDWETVLLPRKKATVITENMMKESWERKGSDRMDTSNYDPNMRRCFVHKDRSDPATIAASERGYKPCRDKAAALASGHQFGKVEGWSGEVAYIGDAVIVHCPEAMASAREARNAHDRALAKAELMGKARTGIEEALDPYRSSHDRQTGVMEDSGYSYRQEVMGGDSESRARLSAESLMEATLAMKGESRPSNGRTNYAGFAGNPEYNKAIPDSPFFRQAVDRMTGR